MQTAQWISKLDGLGCEDGYSVKNQAYDVHYTNDRRSTDMPYTCTAL